MRNSAKMEHIYSVKKSTVFNESWIIWLYCLLLIIGDIAFITKKQYDALIFVTLIISSLIIASLYIFSRYYKYSIDKKLIVNNTYIGMFDKKTDSLDKIRFDEIKEIIVVQPPSFFNRSPWNTYGYISIVGYDNLRITITSFIVNLDIFILECIEGRIRKEQIITKKINYPIF